MTAVDASTRGRRNRASQHECVDCAALPVDDRPQKPRPAVHGGPRSRRCMEHFEARKAKVQRTVTQGGPVRPRGNAAVPLAFKLCGHCGQLMENHRRTYHVECLPAVKAKAQTAKRRCGRCRKTRAASKFVNDASRPDGKFPWCVHCQAAGFAAGRFQNPDDEPNGNVCPLCDTVVRGHKNRRYCSDKCKDRVKSLQTRFGLTVEQYRAMVKATNGSCPLCGCRARMWAVDHDHRTGLVTGVVCTGCNVGLLAASRHDLTRVEALMAYLKHTPAARLGIHVQVPEDYKAPKSNLHKIWKHGATATKETA